MTGPQLKSIAFAAIAFFCLFARPVSAQMPKFGPECAKLKPLIENSKALQARINNTKIGDRRA